MRIRIPNSNFSSQSSVITHANVYYVYLILVLSHLITLATDAKEIIKNFGEEHMGLGLGLGMKKNMCDIKMCDLREKCVSFI